ncbi:MAG: CPBP family intramembrane metalloprotease [Verrucomicrobiae bacterium]|nr:CPBP family intramembrane metalloprotease [Verrucomicrobiae bacterium]
MNRVGLCLGVALFLFPCVGRPADGDGNSAEEARKGTGRVTFSMHREREGEPLQVKWRYPRRLAAQFEGQASEEARTAFGIGEMRKQAAAGDRVSEFELGYFYLYGIGVSRDLGEAKARFRVGLEIGRCDGAWRLGWELACGDEGNRDMAKAADLVLGALRGGCREAADTGVHIAQHLARKARPRDPLRAGEIMEAVLNLKPDEDSALALGAMLRLERKDFSGAWEMATRALAAPGVSERNRVVARSLRWASAQGAGKVGELDASDVREPLAFLFRKTPKPVLIGGGVMLSFGVLVVLGLLAFATRRWGGGGPGILLTACWVGVPAIAFGLGLFAPIVATGVGIAVLGAAVLALPGGLRDRYFPMRRPALGGLVRAVGAVIGCVAVVYGIASGYEAAYRAITGRSPDLQLVAALLRAETFPEFSMLLFVAAICIPAVEEIAFRGFLLDWLRRRVSWAWAIAICAAAFGLIHGPAAALPTAAIGAVAGWLRMRFGNLWVPTALHGLNNGIAVLLLWLGVM